MLPKVRLEATGDDIGPEFARALPVARLFDLARPVESLQECMRHADHAFLLDVTGENPLSWSYCAEVGVERLNGAAYTVSCLGEQPDPQFTQNVLIRTYVEVLAVERTVVHRVAAIANDTFLAYRKLTIPLHKRPQSTRASHILTLTHLEFALPQIRAHAEAVLALAPRERQCLSLAATGLVSKQIAAEIGVSEKTVELHLARARHKIGARTTTHAVAISLISALCGADHL
jgi:DNA-binding CsgD family transcriptional regulator